VPVSSDDEKSDDEEDELLPWQRTLFNIVKEEEADDRAIHFVWDEMGANGKSWFARYLVGQFPERVCIVDHTSTRHTLLAVLESQERLNASGVAGIILIDIPRSVTLTPDFHITAETAKNGNFQSPLKPLQSKTMQCMLLHHPHVLVVTNEQPTEGTLSAMSGDRWNVLTIHPDTQEAVPDLLSEKLVHDITNKRYLSAKRAIAGIRALDADPNKAMVRACFVVDVAATAELAVRKDLFPAMQAKGFLLSPVNLGMLLTTVFAKEIADGIVKTKKGGKKGSRYSGLRII
jgi:hypothetical protein